MIDKNNESLMLSNQICFPLYAASREIIKRYRPFLDPLGLTYTQYLTMLVLWEKKQISVKELGEKLYLDSGTLTPVLKNLDAKGFVSRNRSSADERVLIVTLTKAGEMLRDKAKKIPCEISASVGLEPDELKSLNAVLSKILKTDGK